MFVVVIPRTKVPSSDVCVSQIEACIKFGSVRDLFASCRLKDWLDSLLWDKGSPTQDIYRMKGLLKVAGSSKAHVLQAVHELYDVVPGIAWSDLPAEQQQQNKVVLIGRNLDVVALQAGFRQTVSSY